MLLVSHLGAQLTKFTHLAVIAFVLGGWLLASPIFWKIHAIFIPLMLLQWRFNNDVCVLTTMEQRLLAKSGNKVNFEDNQFVANLISQITGKRASDNLLLFLTWGLPIAAMGLSLYKLLAIT